MSDRSRAATAPSGPSAPADSQSLLSRLGQPGASRPPKLDTDPDLLQDLQEALAQAEAGELIDHDIVMAELRDMFRGRVSAEALRALGEP